MAAEVLGYQFLCRQTLKEMKKEIRIVKNGICQITTFDSRWYSKEVRSPDTGLPEMDFFESSSWISSYYPKGERFTQWVAKIGLEEAQKRMIEAGVKGSKVHLAAEDIMRGVKVPMDAKYPNKNNEGLIEELTVEEYEGIMSLVDWVDTVDIEVLATEITAFNDKEHYAGTVDLICRIDGQIWIIDYKTSPNIWPSHEIQLSSYKHLNFYGIFKELRIGIEEWDNRKIAILQLGYKRSKTKKYKFTEIEDQFNLFLAVKKIWAKECAGIKPKQRDYPLAVQAEKLKKESKVNKKSKTKKEK